MVPTEGPEGAETFRRPYQASNDEKNTREKRNTVNAKNQMSEGQCSFVCLGIAEVNFKNFSRKGAERKESTLSLCELSFFLRRPLRIKNNFHLSKSVRKLA